MTPQLIVAGVIALGSFGTAWRIQDWRYQAKEAEHAEQQLANERSAATAAIRRTETVIQAQSAAAVRERNLRNDAAGARSAAISLHDAAAAAMRDAAVSHAACTERSGAIGELLGTVEEAGRSMAEKADRHALDAETLSAAWPR